jgi:20S proteasome alpha/beta subunit
VIAALELENVPVLMGDFLITTEGPGKSLKFLHTRPTLELPGQTHRITDLRRKCIIINDHLVVAFTGSVRNGGSILRELVRRFAGADRGPTIEKLEKALHHFTFSFDSNDSIVGWTVHNKKPICFTFTSKLHGKVKKVKRAVMGQGQRTLEDYLDNLLTPDYPTVRTAREKAGLAAIALIGRLITDEMATGQPIIERFGGGAEVAVWDGVRFQFIPKIGFFFYNIFIDEAHKVTVQIAGLDTIYENRGRYSMFCTYTNRRVQGQPPDQDARETTASYLAGLLPLHENFKLALEKKDELDYDCPYFFVGFIVQHRLLRQTRVIGVSYPSSDHPLFSITNIGYAHVKSLHKENLMAMIRSIYPEAIF